MAAASVLLAVSLLGVGYFILRNDTSSQNSIALNTADVTPSELKENNHESTEAITASEVEPDVVTQPKDQLAKGFNKEDVVMGESGQHQDALGSVAGSDADAVSGRQDQNKTKEP
jgi:hypothetical protein